MEEASAGRNAAAGAFFIAGEGNVHHLRRLLTQTRYLTREVLALTVARRELLTFLRYRHELNIDDCLAATVRELLKKLRTRHFSVIFRRDSYRGAEDKRAGVELIHILDELVVNAGSAARIGLFSVALNAHYRQQITMLIE